MSDLGIVDFVPKSCQNCERLPERCPNENDKCTRKRARPRGAERGSVYGMESVQVRCTLPTMEAHPNLSPHSSYFPLFYCPLSLSSPRGILTRPAIGSTGSTGRLRALFQRASLNCARLASGDLAVSYWTIRPSPHCENVALKLILFSFVRVRFPLSFASLASAHDQTGDHSNFLS